MHVMNDTADPFYTSRRTFTPYLSSWERNRRLCDPAYPCPPPLTVNGRITIFVVASVVGLGIVFLLVRFFLGDSHLLLTRGELGRRLVPRAFWRLFSCFQ